jgi:hypothetical protein
VGSEYSFIFRRRRQFVPDDGTIAWQGRIPEDPEFAHNNPSFVREDGYKYTTDVPTNREGWHWVYRNADDSAWIPMSEYTNNDPAKIFRRRIANV